ncbi:Hsp20/alpha crystallin family protein [Apilactobacillus xinyiensis]|uniref:Hsp20/alpha crystallin family protein n=1 Tax=Apilactobacillus xinyiensis TaxID=2841032 RepID=UPI002035F386|nr:Hsp20/alpha crystallin family protein [Apilactobacillus xinyiensis]
MAIELRNNMNLFSPMNNFTSDFDDNFFSSFAGNQMRTDVIENKDNYVVTSELPGFKKDNIHLNYRDNKLIIKADHEVNKDNNNKFLRIERSSKSVARSFRIPNIKVEDIKASYDGGILRVTLPKDRQNNTFDNIDID